MNDYPDKKSEPGIRTLSIVFTIMIASALILPTGFVTTGSSVDCISDPSVNGGGADEGIQTITLQPNATAGKDSMIMDEAPWDVNDFGKLDTIWAGNGSHEYRALVEFDVPHETATVGSATLSLYAAAFTGSAMNISAHALSNPWLEGAGNSTSNVVPSATNWTHRIGGNILSLDFEANDGGLVGDNDWEWGALGAWGGVDPQSIPPTTAHSGTNLWATVLNSEYSPLGATNTLTFTVDLSDSALVSPLMTFWDWYDVFEDFDHGEVYVNGVLELDRDFDYHPETDWSQHFIDLSAYVGGVATIEFRMYASTVVNRAGWYIDDINITESIAWDIPGGDYYVSNYSYIVVPQAGCTYSWDVTTIVQNWVDGAWENNGFILLSDNPDAGNYNYVEFYSSDYYTDDRYWPKLTINYAAKIDPPVSDLHMNEDDLTVSIPLSGRASGTISHLSAQDQGYSNAIPLWGSAVGDQMRCQYLYTPDQVGADGTIRRISFNRTNPTQTGIFNAFSIRMAHTSLDQLTPTFDNNYNGFLIEVLPPQTIFTSASDSDRWLHFDLNGNFTYDTQHNLVVDIIWNGDSGANIFLRHDNSAWATGNQCYNTTGAAAGTIQNILAIAIFDIDVANNGVVDMGATSGFFPFDISQPQARQQWLWNISELGGVSGFIDKISLFKRDLESDSATIPNFRIALAHTNLDSLTDTFANNYLGSLYNVFFDDSLDIESWNGWLDFDVNNTFNYNGVDNLLVEITWNGVATGTGDISTARMSVPGSNRRCYDFTGAATGTADDTRNNVRVLMIESDELTWSASSSEPWLFSATTDGDELRITPVADANGAGNATLTLTNSNGESISQMIQITINPVNDAPVLAGIPSNITCVEDIDFLLNVSSYASDIDNALGELTFSEDSAYATVDGMDITFNYPEGITFESVTITVSDPEGLTDSFAVNVTVTPVNDPPILSPFADSFVCDATVAANYVVSPEDEETPGNIEIYTNSAYGTVLGNTITFLYPKGIGTEAVTIYVVDGEIYGTQNNVTYALDVTIIDHPEVADYGPSGGGVSLTASVVVTFDVAMNATATESSFTLSTATRAEIDGNFSWSADGTTMTFVPDEYLAAGDYDVGVGTGATDSSGIAMLESFEWNFTADGSADADGDGMADQWEIDGGLDPLADDSASDSDGDGIPNLWEYQNGLDPALNDADLDSDGDGASNIDEYEAGTDPNDPDDKPSSFPWLMIIIVVIVIAIIAAALILLRRGKKPEFENPGQGPGTANQPPAPVAQAPPPAPPAQ